MKMVPIPAVVANNANLPNANEPSVTSFQNPVPIHDFDELHAERAYQQPHFDGAFIAKHAERAQREGGAGG